MSKQRRTSWRVAAILRKKGRRQIDFARGATLLPKKHLELGLKSIESDGARQHEGLDWTCAPIRLRWLTVLVVTVYITDGIGITGINLTKLEQLAKLLLEDGRPFIFMANWGVTPQELQEQAADWHVRIRGIIMTPGIQATGCSDCLLF